MRIAVLTANLGNFDTVVEPVKQTLDFDYHCFTDKDFPPIAGLTPRLQYRIPKTHGWEMFPGYDVYVWLDGAMSLLREDSLQWLLDQMGDKHLAFFKHPWRKNIQEEIDHIEERLQRKDRYITPRYENGLHKEQPQFPGTNMLYASTAFIYKNALQNQRILRDWWYYGSRYFTCDQVNLTYALKIHNADPWTIQEDIFNNPYVGRVSKHR